MPTITTENRDKFISKELAKKSGKTGNSPKFNFPHYQIGDIVKTQSGHIKIHELTNKPQGYMGVWTNPYGKDETKYEPNKRAIGVLHEDVGTGKHHLYAKKGDYPKQD